MQINRDADPRWHILEAYVHQVMAAMHLTAWQCRVSREEPEDSRHLIEVFHHPASLEITLAAAGKSSGSS